MSLRFAGEVTEKGFRVVRHGLIGSTNDEAMTAARSGDPGELWVVAEAQAEGRGRLGRPWVSPPGNLYASLLLIDPAPREKAAELGFVCSVALARALRELTGADLGFEIKWPNDILHHGAKLAGILLESTAVPNGRFACVAGFGVNCRSHPDAALYDATDLLAITGVPISPEIVFERLAEAMAHWLGIWENGAGFDWIRAEWLSLAAGIGTPIRVARPSGSLEGVFETIDTSGRLVLGTPNGAVTVEAADVFLSGCPSLTVGGETRKGRTR